MQFRPSGTEMAGRSPLMYANSPSIAMVEWWYTWDDGSDIYIITNKHNISHMR